MKITQFTDYSLRMLLYLASSRGRVVTVREIAEFYGISAEHLKKIVRRMTELGYIQTVRGKNGGLLLAVEPQAINIGTLLRQEENLCLLPCNDQGDNCPIHNCKLKGVIGDALGAFLAVLDRHTLADIA